MSVLGAKSLEKLKGVHPNLVEIVKLAATISPVAFCITEGLRTIERQSLLVKQGASRTMNSRHITGHAVDLAAMIDADENGKFEISWKWHLYDTLSKAMKAAAQDLGYSLTWGGDWKSFKDGCHFELAWEDYPVRYADIQNEIDTKVVG